MTKRRKFTDNFKARIALEVLRGDKTIQEITAKYQVYRTVLRGKDSDWLSWLRFLGFDLDRPTLDGNTIQTFCERLSHAGAIRALFDELEHPLKGSGRLPMGGQMDTLSLAQPPVPPSNINPSKANRLMGVSDSFKRSSKSQKPVCPDIKSPPPNQCRA